MRKILEVVVWVVKMKEHLPFRNEFILYKAYFVLKIELLLTVLSNFERKAAIKDLAF